jgi:hypothetical protein
LQYVPEERFARIVKSVKRNKKKEQEDQAWLKLLTKRRKKCKWNTENDESESLMPLALCASAQNDLQKYYSADLRVPGSEHMQDDCQKYDAVSSESVTEGYRGTVLNISDLGKKYMYGRDDNVSVVQKTNNEHVQKAKILSEAKLFKHRSNASSETIQEETLCSPDRQYCILNDIEYVHEQRPYEVNISSKSDLLESSQEHYVFEKELYHVLPPAVPKLNSHGMSKEGIHSRRIRIIWKKMDAAFDGVLNLYDKIPEPDGSQDLLRRYKRAAEFSSRLSRNYLYQLRQQVSIFAVFANYKVPLENNTFMGL